MSTAPKEDLLPANLNVLPRWIERTPGFTKLVETLKAGHAGAIDGAWNSAAALAVAALGRYSPVGMVVVLAHPRDVDAWAEDLQAFTGAWPAIFPAWDSLPGPDAVRDETGGQRLRLVRLIESGTPPAILLTTIHALLQPVPSAEQLRHSRLRLRKGQAVAMETVVGWLVEHGFERMEAVEIPGELSQRGGILDVFSPDAEAPYRIEFLGDEIESLRQFSIETQRSLGDLSIIELTAPTPAEGVAGLKGSLFDFLPSRSWTAMIELAELNEQGKHYLERVPDLTGLFSLPSVFQQLTKFPSVLISGLPATGHEETLHLHAESVERFSGEVFKVRDELDSVASRDAVVVACHNDGERQRLSEVFKTSKLWEQNRLRLALGKVRAGFRVLLSEAENDVHGLVVIGDHELFRRDPSAAVLPRRRLESRAIDSFLDLNEDDLVVHLSHGIARYRGMQTLEKQGSREEHLVLEFAEQTKIFVPASKIDLVQKYVGGGKHDPELSRVGTGSWQKKKEKVQAAVLDLASEMLELQAMRQAQAGFAFPADSDWQREFEAAFPYEETTDQLASLAEIKKDMQEARPMDRLICGDVGFGKTELAIRATFKAIDNGKQVAILVPTTVLAEQHYRTFSQRLAEYPFEVECLSRFRSASEQRAIVKRLAEGNIDVIIGTHRLVSKDVQFRDLGLVVIDEEQRFGVEHKEKLKKLRQMVDVLTMTATPIPRTLHLSLLGIRDISNLETPPTGRLSIETRIIRWDRQLIRNAILRELNREGQVYFVHNRVFNIKQIADQILEIVPEAKIAIAHGQMHEDELEKAMVAFVQRRADILLATTIIESGLDIPNANTIFIHQAESYGLADLHQLRGRVGRYKHRAYAYLVLDRDKSIQSAASKRLKAIEEFNELGAGFKIAMRDLEIRGAGNILGTQQSGHIASVGYELYCHLLENAVRSLKQMPVRTHLEVHIALPWPGFLPRDYIPGQKLKIEVYRRLSRLRRTEDLADFQTELRDRYGPLPSPVLWLIRLAELRILAEAWQIADVHLDSKGMADLRSSGEPLTLKSSDPVDVVLGYRNPSKVEKLAKRSGTRLKVVDAMSAYFRLKPAEFEPMKLFQTLKHLLRSPDSPL